jgi:hypothetical protein
LVRRDDNPLAGPRGCRVPAIRLVPKPARFLQRDSVRRLRGPVMGNAGVKEQERGVWINTLARAREYRSNGGPAGFAPDPRTGHECDDSRYLAIPFLDACLAMRLPAKGSNSQNLKPVDMSKAWLAPFLIQTAVSASSYKGNPLGAA